MFNSDPSIEREGDSPPRLQNSTTRLKEMISSDCLVPDGGIANERRRHQPFPFSIRAPAFTRHFFRPKSRSTIDKGVLLERRPSRVGSNRVSFSRSFFKRAINLSVNERTSNTVVDDDDGRISTINPRTLFQREPYISVPHKPVRYKPTAKPTLLEALILSIRPFIPDSPRLRFPITPALSKRRKFQILLSIYSQAMT
ncbi:hypothetical protein H2248_001904 [Termitomyces sp. 'cryptogamus']|nr:hypothetical protein H2248_001904 [Termitomyces sp. 'cryptogamus']